MQHVQQAFAAKSVSVPPLSDVCAGLKQTTTGLKQTTTGLKQTTTGL
jgi:hypothetical protein